jgi:hypothetical protein
MGDVMTKLEFREQFKRLVIAGYRLPSDIPEGEVMAEWYETFAKESADDLAVAITELKKAKADTFWPSIGQVYQGIADLKKARRRQAEMRYGLSEPTEEERDTAAKFWRDMRARFGFKHPSQKATE